MAEPRRRPIERSGRALLLSVAAFGVGVLLFGLSRSIWLSLGLMVFLGAVDNVSVVIRHTLVQMLTPDAMRGRVSAVNGVFIVASNDLGGLESGLSARLLGDAALLVGLGTLAVAAIATRLFPQLRRMGSLQHLAPNHVP